MDDNKRSGYSVDDYYPKSSSQFPEAADNSSSDDQRSEHTQFHQEDTSSYNNSSNDTSGFRRTVTCPNCGNETSSDMNFCGLCGYHFPKSEDTPYPLNNTRIDGYLVEDIATFVGPNHPTYLRKFQNVSEGRMSFNWAAAIFSNRWLAYRGMFKAAVIFSVVVNTISAIISYVILSMYFSAGTTMSEASYSQINTFSIILSIAIGLIVGLVGDSYYWKYAKKQMDRLRCRDREPISNRKISQTLRMRGSCKFAYAMLIICFDLSMNEIVTYILQTFFIK